MATTYTELGAQSFNNQEGKAVKWTLAQGESGDPYVLPGYADRSIQFTGTFGGATVTFEGSNEGADGAAPSNYATLTDPQGNAISKTSAALEAVSEMTRVVRPKVTGGDGTTSIVCNLFAKR